MSKGLLLSILLHLTIVIFTITNTAALWRKKPVAPHEKPIIVDLKDVEITKKTNIPSKPKELKEKTEKPEPKKKEEKKPELPPSKPKPQPKPKPEPEKNVVVPVTPEPPKDKVEKEEKKVEVVKMKPPRKPPPPKKPEPKKEVKKKPPKKKEEDDGGLKSLLASVEELEKNIKNEPEPKNEKPDDNPDLKKPDNKNLPDNGTGIASEKISLSEIDAIRAQLRQCWNVDPGAKGVHDMIVEITVSLAPDGTVKRANIVDRARYNSDSFFKAVADSARRAVFICSPLRVPADRYELWRYMRVFFNPMDGGVQ